MKLILPTAPYEPNYITAEEYWEKYHIKGDGFKNLEEVKRIAARKPRVCDSCGMNAEWKLAQTGMCFVCTTGSVDASDDLEI